MRGEGTVRACKHRAKARRLRSQRATRSSRQPAAWRRRRRVRRASTSARGPGCTRPDDELGRAFRTFTPTRSRLERRARAAVLVDLETLDVPATSRWASPSRPARAPRLGCSSQARAAPTSSPSAGDDVLGTSDDRDQLRNAARRDGELRLGQHYEHELIGSTPPRIVRAPRPTLGSACFPARPAQPSRRAGFSLPARRARPSFPSRLFALVNAPAVRASPTRSGPRAEGWCRFGTAAARRRDHVQRPRCSRVARRATRLRDIYLSLRASLAIDARPPLVRRW